MESNVALFPTSQARIYGLLTAIDAHYGRSIVRYMRHPGDHLWLSLFVTFFIILLTIGFLFLANTPPKLPQEQGVRKSGLANAS